jgi:hypothetical protein
MGFTTENAAYKLMNEVLNALNNEQIVWSVFFVLTRCVSLYESWHINIKNWELWNYW